MLIVVEIQFNLIRTDFRRVYQRGFQNCLQFNCGSIDQHTDTLSRSECAPVTRVVMKEQDGPCGCGQGVHVDVGRIMGAHQKAGPRCRRCRRHHAKLIEVVSVRRGPRT